MDINSFPTFGALHASFHLITACSFHTRALLPQPFFLSRRFLRRHDLSHIRFSSLRAALPNQCVLSFPQRIHYQDLASNTVSTTFTAGSTASACKGLSLKLGLLLLPTRCNIIHGYRCLNLVLLFRVYHNNIFVSISSTSAPKLYPMTMTMTTHNTPLPLCVCIREELSMCATLPH